MTYLDTETQKALRCKDRSTIKTELWLLYFLGFAVAVLFGTWAYTGEDETWEGPSPSIQDEAQTVTSMERN